MPHSKNVLHITYRVTLQCYSVHTAAPASPSGTARSDPRSRDGMSKAQRSPSAARCGWPTWTVSWGRGFPLRTCHPFWRKRATQKYSLAGIFLWRQECSSTCPKGCITTFRYYLIAVFYWVLITTKNLRFIFCLMLSFCVTIGFTNQKGLVSSKCCKISKYAIWKRTVKIKIEKLPKEII